jgi:hypothetical protein
LAAQQERTFGEGDLDASEETALRAALVSRRAHLHPMVIIALGLGLRKREQLYLRRDQIDFFSQRGDCQQDEGKAESRDPNGRIGRAGKTASNVTMWHEEG